MPCLLLRLKMTVLAGSVALGLALVGSLPSTAQIDTSTATFNEAVQAVKDKNFRHAAKLFALQAENNQHDAQYNLPFFSKQAKEYLKISPRR